MGVLNLCVCQASNCKDEYLENKLNNGSLFFGKSVKKMFINAICLCLCKFSTS